MNNYYSLHRKEILDSFFVDLCPLLESCGANRFPNITEIAQAINSVYWGKHRIIQRPWVFREGLANAMCTQEMAPLGEMRDGSDPVYDGFINSLQDHFSGIAPRSDLRQHLEEGMAGFIDDYARKWEAGEIRHMCDVTELVFEDEDIARMNEIETFVLRHKALLRADWLEPRELAKSAR
ncbi:MAG: hypothetical protein IPM23_27235 [Candidatus Melainabacteria bacterium]|nr:hypothetical protein [Candidatus Melainabacteria bacterium]